MTNKKRAGASVLMALGGLMAAWMLLAGPVGADPSSVGPNAFNGSTSSGQGIAVNGSTASGSGVAINGSTSSGCATAVDLSTASGGSCAPQKAGEVTPAAAAVAAAPVATPVAAKALAFTGSSMAGPLALAAAALVALGSALVVGTRRAQPQAR
jgi:hypothetical protein